MASYVLKKLVQFVVVMVLVSFASFAVIHFAPGDAASMYVSQEMTPAEVAAVRANLGLDKSLPEQYLAWAGMALRGDWGVSLANHLPVAGQLARRLPATLLLMGCSLVVSVGLAVPLGLIAALREGKPADLVIGGLSYVGMSVPSFWFGMLLIILFSAVLHLLPTSGMYTPGGGGPGDLLAHLVMPVATLCLADLAVYIRYVRANAVRELGREYVVAARARGDTRAQVLARHVLRNALLPVVTLLGMNLSTLVCGSFIVETVFGWPGIGTFAMQAIGARDYPVIMAFVMLSGSVLCLSNLAADVVYGLVDPRIRGGEA